jgi:hypothetical protein
MPGRAGTPDKQEALATARRLLDRGDDYEAIVWRLVFDLGFEERAARALVAEALPGRRRYVTLRAELETILRKLDAVRQRG